MSKVAQRVWALAGLRALVMAALTAPAVVGLSLLVIEMVGRDAAPPVLARISVLGSVVAMVANPLLGWSADRWPGPSGSRRWWLVGGAALGLAGSAMMAWADGVWALTAGWMIAQAGYNGCFGALNGLVSTLLEPRWHQRAAGAFTASAYLGTLPALALAAVAANRAALMVIAFPIVALVVVAVAAPFLPSPPTAAVQARIDRSRESARPKTRLTPGVHEVLRGPFAAIVLIRVVIAAELAAALTFGVYVAMTRWSATATEAATFVATMTVAGSVGVVTASLLLALPWSRRKGNRFWLLVSLGGIAISSLLRGFAFDVPMFLVATVIGGLAIGCGMTATRAVAHAVLPPQESGMGLGLLNVGNTLGPILGPLLAGAALGLGLFAGIGDEYVGMFVVLALPALGAMVVTRWIPGSKVPAVDSRGVHIGHAEL